MEALKNEIKKTLEVWGNKDIWKQRFKNLYHLVGCVMVVSVIVVIFPMPTRCRIENHEAYRPANDILIGASVIRDCYPPHRAEFWQNPQWSFEFRWLFIPTIDSVLGHGVSPSIINIHLSYPVDQ